MIIAVDEAIPYGREAFSELGEIRLIPARDLKPESIRDADALIVRTVTRVDASLLEGSSVRFVASASAGIDHIDQSYLSERGVHFEYAAGCNAEAVSEYIVTALFVVASRRKWNLKEKSLAIVGVGNVGSRVEKKARALGMVVRLCDPPLRDVTGEGKYEAFEDILGADIVTFHVPLIREGLYPTWHMLNQRTLDRLQPGQFLINSARGAVFDNSELKAALKEERVEGAVLDVWEGEPAIDYALLDRADIGTPHIAGIALDGKIRATEMVHQQACNFFGLRSLWRADSLYPGHRIVRPEGGVDDQSAVLSVLLQAYNIMNDDAGLRDLRTQPAGQAAIRFEQLRIQCALRPEFRHFIVELKDKQMHMVDTLSALGFVVRNGG